MVFPGQAGPHLSGRVPPPGWYTGPFPPLGLSPRPESFGRAIGLSSLKALITVALVIFGVVVVTVVFFLLLGGLIASAGAGEDSAEFVFGDETSANKLLSIPVSGIILGEEADSGGLFSPSDLTFGYDVKDQLADAAEDDAIAGIVLEMNTPGGTASGSAAIADGVVDYQKKTGKPVVAYVADLSASGGMWAMSPADRILADEGTTIGSIGVISGPFPYFNGVIAQDFGLFGGGVETTNGIEYTTITSGRGKDMGNPFRPLTTEEIAILQKGNDNTYAAFVRQIASTRAISEETIRDDIGAFVYDNKTAEELGLVDGTAGRDAAYAEAADLADLPGNDWRVVREPLPGGGLAGLFGARRTEGSENGESFPDFCTSPSVSLAYYGDPAALCTQPD